jgi:phospho-N-acetylmuramoyl-pentapeptide-transferase
MLTPLVALAGGGFVIAVVAGFIVLRILRRVHALQHAYEDAPQSHQKKTGTPTMGGIVFIVPMLILTGLKGFPFVAPMLFLVAACGAIGFADDLLGIVRGKNQGLRARTKYLASALVAIIFLWLVDGTTAVYPRDVLFHAGTFVLSVPHWLWLVLGILAVTGTIHAVNLTDGLDGLATGTMIPPLIVLAVIGYASQLAVPMASALIGLGACFGFLVFNLHPAKMFMGDTGSLALGALLSGIAIIEGEMLLLVLIGGVFVAEALSVIVQVTYFKATHGKRIFKMSPLHHHFELSGWPETKVTASFWTASVLLSTLGWAVTR